MEINFSFTPLFEKDYKRLLKKYPSLPQDILNFQEEYAANPAATGNDLGAGFRKVRMSISSKQRGKSGGARVITYDLIITETAHEVLLVTMYDKSELESMDIGELKKIVKGFTGR